MIYKIADLIIEAQADARTLERGEPYVYDGDSNIDISISPGTLEAYKSKDRSYSFEDYEYMSLGSNFYKKLLDFNGIMLHSSAVVVDNKAYLFSAASGTGKSTHTNFWLELFGDRAFILNDDKPALRILDDGIYAYGTPWSGKNNISANKKVKVQAICIIKRDIVNSIRPMDSQNAFLRIYHSTVKKLSQEQALKSFQIINQIIKEIPIYELGCTPTIDAAILSYNYMSKRGNNYENK